MAESSQPDNCDGTYSANCDASRTYSNISDIISASGNDELLQYMQKYWTSNEDRANNFWKHEWNKHGTCISTLEPSCYSDNDPIDGVVDYFQTTVNLFKTLPGARGRTDHALHDEGLLSFSTIGYDMLFNAGKASLSASHVVQTE